tara:strand:- start:137 stop:538 length:402 start_codon:yes stop_codon:yes gene_type:complete
MATRVSKGFNDISLSFAKHPVTNDILVLKNEDAIKRAVQNLIQTNIGERYYNRNLGTTVNESLFELTTMETSTILKEEIKTVIRNFEPRVVLRKVDVNVPDDANEVNILLDYEIVGQQFSTQNVEFLLQSTRI